MKKTVYTKRRDVGGIVGAVGRRKSTAGKHGWILMVRMNEFLRYNKGYACKI